MRLLVEKPLAKRITALAVPVIFAMAAQNLINLLDTAMVGHLPGSTGVNGISAIWYSLPIFWAIGGFLVSIAIGTQALTARRTGEGLPEEAGKVLTNSLILGAISSLVVSIAGYFTVPNFFKYMVNNQDIVNLGSDYCAIRMLGIFSMVTTMSYKAFFDGVGKTYVHLVASIVMNLLNVLLNYCLIYGEWGFPRWEVAGAAWASVISTYVGLSIMVYWSLFAEKKLLKNHRYYRLRNRSRTVAWKITKLSVPSGLATVFIMSGVSFFMWVVGHLPKEPDVFTPLNHLPLIGALLVNNYELSPDLTSAATGLINNFVLFFFVLSMAFGTATNTLVGQSLGASKPNLAERYGWESVKLGMYVMGTIGLFIIIWPATFLAPFSKSQAVIATAVPALRLIGAVTSLMSAGMILVQALYGAGNSRFVMIAEFTMHFVCLVPLSWLMAMPLGLGMLGAWIAVVIYVILMSSIMAWKFNQGTWKDIRI